MLKERTKTLDYTSGTVEEPGHPDNKALLSYWNRHRQERGALARSDFDPLHVPKQLPGLFLAEPVGTDFRFRLVGSQVEERIRRKLTGKTLSDIYADDLARQTADMYREVASSCTPKILRGHYVEETLKHIEFEALHMAIEFEDGSRGILGGQFAFD